MKVQLRGPYKTAAGQPELEVEATNIRELLDALGKASPKLKPLIDAGVTLAIDGEVYNNAWFHPIKPDSEVFILPRIQGG